MKARIHWTTLDGTEDYIELSGSLEEIQESADQEVTTRGGINPWSEILEE